MEKVSPILIIGPMECEFRYLVESLLECKTHRHLYYTYYEGKLDGKYVVICNSLIGTINVTTSVSYAIEKYHPRMIIVQGTSGAHNINLKQGDIVLGKDNIFLNAYDTISSLKGEGINVKSYTLRGSEIKDNIEGNKFITNYPSDPKLLEIASLTKYKYGDVVLGVHGSGDMWNKEVDMINSLHDRFSSDIEEMEDYAVAHLAYMYKIPFISIRVVSNSELQKDATFNRKYGEYSQIFTRSFLKNIID